ncbi:MAG TPA: hypothetical protein DCP32_03110 [Anaerolineaceae bacterium]|nr:MAG: hypothetical protein A2X24_03245 [Chloroflexi bacterium GWB2_54_36]HAL15765.1 hypothetical protein [Anaerolineaceae bacterium]HBA90226.1 hypothetical protein [Anaerolineaceae bacterium]
MLDDLRNSATQSFIDDMPVEESAGGLSDGHFLGMTAPQRFLVSVLLLVMTCAMGTLLLIAFNKVGI